MSCGLCGVDDVVVDADTLTCNVCSLFMLNRDSLYDVMCVKVFIDEGLSVDTQGRRLEPEKGLNKIKQYIQSRPDLERKVVRQTL